MVIMKIKNILTVSLETHEDTDVFEDIFKHTLGWVPIRRKEWK